MDRSNPYFRQVELLVRVLPHVAKQGCFALKGGTAINLFVRDLPRLSVDIDLAYLPLDARDFVGFALGADDARRGGQCAVDRCRVVGLSVTYGAALIDVELRTLRALT